MRIGIGYDVHRFGEGRKIIIGGVKITYERGLKGHSDADVLIHAVMDALLGAANLGDIGKLFPDTDKTYRDIDSRILLRRVKGLLLDTGWKVGNIDSVIIAQEPKMASYIPAMKRNLSEDLGIKEEQVSIKATTTEGLGFEGRKEGIAAQCVALLERRQGKGNEEGPEGSWKMQGGEGRTQVQ